MSKSGGTATTLTQSQPPEFQLPYIKDVMGEAAARYWGPGPSMYPGNLVAPFSDRENFAREVLSGATGKSNEIQDWTQRGFSQSLALPFSTELNPRVQSMANAATAPIIRQLTEQALPNIRAGSVAEGGFGGTRQSLAEALATERTARAAMETQAGIYGNAYGQELGNFGQMMGLAPAVQQMPFVSGSVLSNLGMQERLMEQAKINEAATRWGYEQNLPYQRLAEFSNLVTGPFGGTGMQTTTAPEVGTAQQLLGGGMMLLPLIRSLWGIFGGK